MDSNANSTKTNNNTHSHTVEEFHNFLSDQEERINKYTLIATPTKSAASDYISLYFILCIGYYICLGLLLTLHFALFPWLLSNTALIILGTIAVLSFAVMLCIFLNNYYNPVSSQPPESNGYALLGLTKEQGQSTDQLESRRRK